MRFLSRLGDVVFALLSAIDVVACTLWLSPLYLVGLADKPTGRELISGYVGGAAVNGQRWAQRAERVINRLFWWEPDHCRAVYRRYG